MNNLKTLLILAQKKKSILIFNAITYYFYLQDKSPYLKYFPSKKMPKRSLNSQLQCMHNFSHCKICFDDCLIGNKESHVGNM